MPRLLLISDPSYPDRTKSILHGTTRQLVVQAQNHYDLLAESGADVILFCCFTIHSVLKDLVVRTAPKIVSLPDLAANCIGSASGRILVFSTSGSRQAGVFSSGHWQLLQRRLCFPNRQDQAIVDRSIEKLKLNGSRRDVWNTLVRVGCRYQATTWLLGCTELHMLSRASLTLMGRKIRVVDPLRAAARMICTGDLVALRGHKNKR